MVKPSAVAAALAGVVGVSRGTLRIQPIREDRYPKPKQGKREMLRRQRKIASGRLTAQANG